jgi:hypothetical protein
MKRKPKVDKGSADFTSLIAQAEKAVTNVKDDRLREIAFERVLDHLLSGSINQDIPHKQVHTTTQTSRVAKAAAPKPATGTLAWLTELHGEGFFKEPKCLKDILEELSNRSHRLKSTDLTFPLQKLCHDKKLRRNKQVPAEGGRKVFHWHNW